jgi:hypothetical protein
MRNLRLLRMEEVGCIDPDAAGKDAFAAAVGRVQRRSAEEQLGIAWVIFALLSMIEALSEEGSKAIQDRIASIGCGEDVLMEESKIFEWLKSLDPDAAGKDAFAAAVSRMQRRSSKEQGDIACIVFALLDDGASLATSRRKFTVVGAGTESAGDGTCKIVLRPPKDADETERAQQTVREANDRRRGRDRS